MSKIITECRDCGKTKTEDTLFHGGRCLECFKSYDAARGRKIRDAKRQALGKIKPGLCNEDGTRECSVCRKVKDGTNDFFWIKRSDGRSIPERKCKACKYEWFIKYRNERRETYSQYARNWRMNNAEKHAAQRRKNRATEKSKETERRYVLRNKERILAVQRRWSRSERGRIRTMIKRQKRRMWKAGAITDKSHLITERWLTDLFKSSNSKCAYCLNESKLTMDHATPISKGGKHEPDNIVPACHSCNSGKRDKLVSQWRPWVVIPSYCLDLATG